MRGAYRARASLARLREQIRKSNQAAAKLAQARVEAEENVRRRWFRLPEKHTRGSNFDYAVQAELDASPVARGLIASDQLARDRAQMHGLEATADLLEYLVETVERLETRIDTTQYRPPQQRRHAG